MTVKDEYEYLKTDLMIRLSETTEACNLDCPFNFRFSKEEENKFLPRGTMGRLAVKRAFIILDNTYKKVRLYPTDEFINIFKETMEDIFKDMTSSALSANKQDRLFFRQCSEEEFEEYIKELIPRIKDAIKPYIEELEKLTPEDVEREIKIKDKVKKAKQERLIQGDDGNKGELFS